jgi:integrase
MIVAGMSSTTAGHCVRLLSVFFSDLVERGIAQTHPVRALPRATRRLMRNAHDPKTTPFLEKQEDIARVFLALEQPFATLFAIGVFAGLRPGEVVALEWGDVDLDARRILVKRQVRHGRVGPPKSGKPRVVPVIQPLAKILAERKLATGGTGKLFPPLNPKKGGQPKSPPRFLDVATVLERLRAALRACELPGKLTLYECTRHTFGAQHVMGGGSLATLREILGHSSVQVTERYGHLRPDLFREGDLMRFAPDLTREGAKVVDLVARRDERAISSDGVSSDSASVDKQVVGGR